MSIVDKLRLKLGLAVMGRQASITDPRDLLAELSRGGMAITGAAVNSETAMAVSAVSRSVRIISGTIASMPLILYRRTAGEGKERAQDNPLYNLLRYKPNGWQTSLEFRETMQAIALLRGTAYAKKHFVGNRVDQLEILSPDRMAPTLKKGKLLYEYTRGDNSTETLEQKDVFRLPGLSFDGITGRSVITDHKESIGLAISQEAFGANSYARGGTKRHALSHPAKLSQDAAERMRSTWESNYGGIKNLGRVVVLEEGMKLEAIDMTAEDMEYIEARRFQVSDIARIFGVPLPLLQEGEKGTAWGSGIEQLSLAFLIYTLQPWLVRWEQAIQRDILGEQASDELFAEHLVDAVLRADIEKRYAAYQIGIQNGVLNADEVRARENMNAQPGGQGKAYHIPGTWSQKGQPLTTVAAPAPAAPQEDNQ